MTSATAVVDDAVPAVLVKGDDESLARDAVRAVVDALVGTRDRTLTVDEFAGDDYELGAVVDAARTPPFLTDRRVIVARDLARFTKAADVASLVDYLADPSPEARLVLAWASGRMPKVLVDALKAAGAATVEPGPGSGARQQRAWVAERVAAAAVRLDARATDLLAATIGEDVERLSGILATLEGTFGPGARLGADDVAPYAGHAGSVAPWDLTDAIDRGDIVLAVDRLHRLLAAGDRHALVLMATLHGHLGRMLALDGSDARTERDAAAVLGLKGSTFPAKKALDGARRLGSARLAQAIGLLAQADLDIRGASAVPDQLVLEVLVARLAHLSRR
ncbi:MAG: DNA polymerase III subunit delta [Acidimicrobiales bacterium]